MSLFDMNCDDMLPGTVLLPASVNAPEFSHFLARVREIPLLTHKEEQELFQRFRADGDKQAAHLLVFSHMRLVVKTAREYMGYGLPLPDLVQEGAVGLMRAVKRFEPWRGVRLSTYALWWIRASIHEFILASFSLVKIGATKLKRHLFFKLRQAKKGMAPLGQEEAEALSDHFGTDAKTLMDMDGRLSGGDDSLNRRPLGDGAEFLEMLPDERPNQEAQLLSGQRQRLLVGLIEEGMERLDERERLIVTERILTEPAVTLDQLGKRLSVTRERVRQLEKRALLKLKAFLKDSPRAEDLLPAMEREG